MSLNKQRTGPSRGRQGAIHRPRLPSGVKEGSMGLTFSLLYRGESPAEAGTGNMVVAVCGRGVKSAK